MEPRGRPRDSRKRSRKGGHNKHAGLTGAIEVARDEVNLRALSKGFIEGGRHRAGARHGFLGNEVGHVHAQDGDGTDATARLGPLQADAVPVRAFHLAVPERVDGRLHA